MATRAATQGNGGTAGAQGSAAGGIDWQGIEESPEFRELKARRRAFLVPATVVFLVVFGLYLLLSAFAKEFMGTQVVDGLPISFLFALGQIFMTWIFTFAYMRKANSTFEPLEQRAAARAQQRVVAGEALFDGPVDGGAPTGSAR